MEPIIDIVCPITHQIFLNPVVCSDGFTYEENAILKALETKPISPMTNTPLEHKSLSPNFLIKKYITSYLDQFPEKKEDQYKDEYYYFTSCKELLEYLYKILNPLTYIDFIKKCRNIFSDEIIVAHWISNFTDLEEKDEDGWRLIHFICSFSTFNMIKLICEKGVNLEALTTNNASPIHLLCRNNLCLESIKFFVEQGVDLEIKTADKKHTPIMVACEHNTVEVIRYLINKGVNLNIINDNGQSILDLIIKNKNIKSYDQLFR